SPSHPKSIESPRHAANVERLDKLVLIGYVLCGTAFVLPAFATIAALWIAFRIQSLGAREPARLQFILCAIFTFLGLFFWLFLWITW
ncbi:MAG: hypothetical protein LBV28_03025, partial [Puniceicoccales bacterium]|nr:hypothetical protein [Puniceicoccales bacterium]